MYSFLPEIFIKSLFGGSGDLKPLLLQNIDSSRASGTTQINEYIIQWQAVFWKEREYMLGGSRVRRLIGMQRDLLSHWVFSFWFSAKHQTLQSRRERQSNDLGDKLEINEVEFGPWGDHFSMSENHGNQPGTVDWNQKDPVLTLSNSTVWPCASYLTSLNFRGFLCRRDIWVLLWKFVLRIRNNVLYIKC